MYIQHLKQKPLDATRHCNAIMQPIFVKLNSERKTKLICFFPVQFFKTKDDLHFFTIRPRRVVVLFLLSLCVGRCRFSYQKQKNVNNIEFSHMKAANVNNFLKKHAYLNSVVPVFKSNF